MDRCGCVHIQQGDEILLAIPEIVGVLAKNADFCNSPLKFSDSPGLEAGPRNLNILSKYFVNIPVDSQTKLSLVP